jgi:RNA polymerase sigma-70 factor (ECF subfamily)
MRASVRILPDHKLVSLYLQGDETALEELLARHQERIFSFILSKVKDRQLAEDLFQETFFKVINTLKTGGYQEEGKFIHWIMRIAHNLIIDYYRKKSKMNFYEGNEEFDVFDVLAAKNESYENELIKQQIHKKIKQLLQYLPKEQKEIVYMRIYLKMSFKEIASCLDISINTALGRMRYAILNLRKLVKKHHIPIEDY